jgi:hypothetical protein
VLTQAGRIPWTADVGFFVTFTQNFCREGSELGELKKLHRAESFGRDCRLALDACDHICKFGGFMANSVVANLRLSALTDWTRQILPDIDG